MIDVAIESILWSLLNHASAVELEQVCWWDSARAERACLLAHLRWDGEAWRITEDTAAWFEETWSEIRDASKASKLTNPSRTSLRLIG